MCKFLTLFTSNHVSQEALIPAYKDINDTLLIRKAAIKLLTKLSEESQWIEEFIVRGELSELMSVVSSMPDLIKHFATILSGMKRVLSNLKEEAARTVIDVLKCAISLLANADISLLASSLRCGQLNRIGIKWRNQAL